MLSLYNGNEGGNSLERRLLEDTSLWSIQLAQNDEPCPPYLKCNKKDTKPEPKKDDNNTFRGDNPYQPNRSEEPKKDYSPEKSNTANWVLLGVGGGLMLLGYVNIDNKACVSNKANNYTTECGTSAPMQVVIYGSLIGGAGMSLVGLIGLLSK